MPDSSMPDSKPQTRSAMRRARRALSPAQQRLAAERLARIISCQPFFLRSRRLAMYLANDGEIDPDFLLRLAARAGKQIYLPVLHPFRHNRLLFQRHRPGEPLVGNRYGIAEPPLDASRLVPSWSLDAVFLPLVAFDRDGNRLGMGGGFYDRTFAGSCRAHHFRPLLIGLAHRLQELASVPAAPWDIPLDAIATDHRLLYFRPGI